VFVLFWKYDRQVSLGGFPELGDIPALGDAEILLNGTVIANPSIAPTDTQVLSLQQFVLPNTGLSKIKLRLPTTTSYEIFTEFEAQVKPLY
jgi:hypothetical protein